MNKKNKITFNKSDILTTLDKEFPSLTKIEISKALDIILDTIVESVALDEIIQIRGFGTFSKKYIRPRKFMNPKTKQVSFLGETSTLHFKPSKSIIKWAIIHLSRYVKKNNCCSWWS